MAECIEMADNTKPLVVRLSDSVTILREDCIDVLPVECDTVLTDQPYGVEAEDIDVSDKPTDLSTLQALWIARAEAAERAGLRGVADAIRLCLQEVKMETGEMREEGEE